MRRPVKIVILGASLFMQMIADGLTQVLDAKIVCLNPHAPDALAQAVRLSPDVVIIEHTPKMNPGSWLTFELLYSCPGVRVVVLDTRHPTTLLLSSTRLFARTIQELGQALIPAAGRPSPTDSRPGGR